MKVIDQTAKKNVSWSLIILMLIHTTSCNFYHVQKLTRDDAGAIQEFREPDKTIILHAGGETFKLSELKLDSTILSGHVLKIDSSGYFYKKNRVKKDYDFSEKAITKEVHFYLKEGIINPSYVEIPIHEVEEIHVISYDNQKSVINSMILVGGVIVLSYYIVVGIFLLGYGACYVI